MRALWWIAGGIWLLGSFPALAATKDELAKTQAELRTSKAVEAKLAKQQSGLEKELRVLQEKLVRVAAELQKSEAKLANVENQLQELEQDVLLKEASLKNKRSKLDGLMRIVVRLSRTPPQAIVLMPADGKSRMQAAHALSLLTAQIKTEAAALRTELEALAQMKKTLAEDKVRAEKLHQANLVQKKSLAGVVAERKKLYDRLASNRAQEDARITVLAKRASSLQELMATLNSEAKKRRTDKGKEVVSTEGIAGRHGNFRSFREAKGRIRIPASGKLLLDYGEDDGAGGISKGVRIGTRKAATVVAPFDAEVAYSGTFLNFGKLVILKHRGDYHTLLAGLARIDVKVGDTLLEGEPIGAMGSTEESQLYVELRENNQPVNPARWMRGL